MMQALSASYKQIRTTGSSQEFYDLASQCLEFLWLSPTEVNKTLSREKSVVCKILGDIDGKFCNFPDLLQCKSPFSDAASVCSDDLEIWNILLSQSSTVQEISKKNFLTLLSRCVKILEENVKREEGVSALNVQQAIVVVVKTQLLLFQNFPDLCLTFAKSSEFSSSVFACLQLSFVPEVFNDTLLVAAMVVAFGIRNCSSGPDGGADLMAVLLSDSSVTLGDKSCSSNASSILWKLYLVNSFVSAFSHLVPSAEWQWIGCELCKLTQMSSHLSQGFRILHLWTCRLCSACKAGQALRFDGQFLLESAHLVVSHCDSPVDSVSSLVLETTKLLLQTFVDNEKAAFLAVLREHFERLTWAVKSKYLLLAVLLPHVQMNDVVHELPNLLDNLRINYLVPGVVLVFEAVIAQSSSFSDGWRQSVLPKILSCIVSPERLVSDSVCQRILPLFLGPAGGGALADLQGSLVGFSPSDRLRIELELAACADRCGTRRALDEAVLSAALQSPVELIRQQAFVAICITRSKSEIVSSAALSLLRCHLPLNISSDSAPFRQKLLSCMKALLNRLRDSAKVMLKQRLQQTALAEQVAEFVDWLWRFCLSGICPESSYQKMKTCLEWSSVIIDCFNVESDRLLLPFLHSLNFCLFCQQKNFDIFLTAVLYNIEEVRSLSISVLKRHFAAFRPSSAFLGDLWSDFESSRPQDSEASSTLIPFALSSDGEALELLCRKLLGKIEDCLDRAAENLLQCAKEISLHGFVLTLGRALEHLRLSRPLLAEVISSCTRVIHRAMSVLGGSSGKMPSFQQMSISVSAAIAATDDPDFQLSPDHQLLFSWLWHCLKECCGLLARLVQSSLPIMTCQQVLFVSGHFVDVFTRCRHRGAIESCNAAFVQLCTSLFLCDEPQVRGLPQDILRRILDGLDGELSSISITRRAAGYPPMITSILVAESRIKQSALLSTALRCLFRRIERDPAAAVQTDDETTDLPQTLALHILKSIFGETALAQQTMPHLAQATIIAISGLASPCWSKRNASMQLYGALVLRLLGTGVRSERGNSVSAAEFFSRFPALEPFILNLLQSLSPCLFPLVCLLSRLQPSRSCAQLEPVRVALERLAPCPIMKVREGAAKAVVAFVGGDCRIDYLFGRINSLKELKDVNAVHGCLLQVRELCSFSSADVQRQVAEIFRDVLTSSRCNHQVLGHVMLQIVKLGGALLPRDLASDGADELGRRVFEEAVAGVLPGDLLLGKLRSLAAGARGEVLQEISRRLRSCRLAGQVNEISKLLLSHVVAPQTCWIELTLTLRILLLAFEGHPELRLDAGADTRRRLCELFAEEDDTPATLGLRLFAHVHRGAAAGFSRRDQTLFLRVAVRFCRFENPLDVRLAAAQALAVVAARLNLSDGATIARLLSAMNRCLFDVEAEVRDAASRIVRALGAGQQLTHPTASVKDFYSWLSTTGEMALPAVADVVFGYSVPCLQRFADKRLEVFEVEDVNPYFEVTTQLRHLAAVVMKFSVQQVMPVISSHEGQVLKNIEVVASLLDGRDGSCLYLSAEKNIFRAIFVTFLQASIFLHFSEPTSTVAKELRHLSLQERDLHPHLLALLRREDLDE